MKILSVIFSLFLIKGISKKEKSVAIVFKREKGALFMECPIFILAQKFGIQIFQKQENPQKPAALDVAGTTSTLGE